MEDNNAGRVLHELICMLLSGTEARKKVWQDKNVQSAYEEANRYPLPFTFQFNPSNLTYTGLQIYTFNHKHDDGVAQLNIDTTRLNGLKRLLLGQ